MIDPSEARARLRSQRIRRRRRIRRILGALTRWHLLRTRPRVVGVTGSFGKTTTVSFLERILEDRFEVRAPRGDTMTGCQTYLTVLGETALVRLGDLARALPGVAVRTLFRIRRKPHRAILLEFRAQHAKGRVMDEVIRTVRPEIGIVTAIEGVHLTHFKTIEAVAETKGRLVEGLREGGIAILNADDERVRALRSRARGKVLLYGTAPDADVRGTLLESAGPGLRVRVSHGDASADVDLPGLWNPGHLVCALGALAAAECLGVPFAEAAAALSQLCPPARRGNRVPGILGSTLVDDTYNANPRSVAAALAGLARAKSPLRIAILGDMLELGSAEAEAHRAAGRLAAGACDLLVCVGRLARFFAEGAREAGMPPDRILEAANAPAAAAAVLPRLVPGAIVWLKGSHDARLDLAVKALRRPMA
ncbi:MAG: Mur ligase family protein [Planctomycetota bacterium]